MGAGDAATAEAARAVALLRGGSAKDADVEIDCIIQVELTGSRYTVTGVPVTQRVENVHSFHVPGSTGFAKKTC